MKQTNATAGIIGLGVMGGSFASRLKQMGYTVYGFDTSKPALQKAEDLGMIDAGFSDFSQGLGQCDMLIFCIYPSLLPDWLSLWQSYMKPGALILEISGVKRAVMEPAHDIIRNDVQLVSVHPMCGKESRGLENSSPDIFAGSNFILIPHESNPEPVLESVLEFAREMGFGCCSRLDAQSHDDMIAFLSQLTHVIAVCLMNTHENAHLVEYTGDSFRDLTRIARINEDMWSELFLLNKDVLLEEIRQFRDSLDHFTQALEDEDSEEMKRLFIQSTKRREKFQR